MINNNLRKWVVLVTLNALLGGPVAEAATVTLATKPLANTTTDVVYPNLMFVLDNSGSMAWSYLPDYVSRGTGSQICWSGASDISTRASCSGVASTGSDVAVPYATSDINYIYYNPTIRYLAPKKADGTSYPDIFASAANTDGFAATGSTNLATSYIKTATASAGSTSVTLSNTTSLAVGMVVVGVGIDPGTFLVTTTNPVTISKPTTAALATTSLSFTSGAYSHQIFCSTSSSTDVQKYGARYAASTTTTTGTTTSSSTSVTSVSTTGLFVGMAVAASSGIASGTTIAAITGPTALTLSANATASGSRSLTFAPVCMENGGTNLYPTVDTTATYKYTNVTTYAGAPFYYTMGTLEYCTDSYFRDCKYTSDATHTIPAKYRWCDGYSTSTHGYTSANCHDLRTKQYTIPDYLGSVWPAISSDVAATASLTVNSNLSGRSITSLTINGVDILSSTGYTNINNKVGGSNTATDLAKAICDAIRTNPNTSPAAAYNCPTTASSATQTITASTAGSAPNGYQVVLNGPAATAASKATGSITITSTSGATKVDGIAVGTTSILTGSTPVNFPDGTQTATIASTLASLVGNGYSATVDSGNASKINVTATTDGAAAGTLAVSASTSSAHNPTGSVQFTQVDSSMSITNVYASNLSFQSGCSAQSGATTVTLMSSAVTSSGSTSALRRQNMANGVKDKGAPSGWTVSSDNVDTVTYVAPSSTYNNWYICAKSSGRNTISRTYTHFDTATAAATAQSTTATGMTGGSNGTGALDTNATSPSALYMGGGATAGVAHRADVGKFTRVDIVPSVDSYTKSPGRADCVTTAGICTYAEELQNFANWYGYYRTRMLAMKSASTIAFDALDGNFRVGFDRLSKYNSGTVELQVAQFQNTGGETANQRSTWWTDLTGATTYGSTPLRSEVNKIGKYFAGYLSTISGGTPAQAAAAATSTMTVSYGTSSGGTCSKSKYTSQSKCTRNRGTWTPNPPSGGVSNGDTITSIKVGSVEVLGSTKTVSCAASACTNSEINSLATSLASMISSYVSDPDYTASASSNVITITAPLSLGASPNGEVVGATTSGTIKITTNDMAGGKDATDAVAGSVDNEPMQYSCQQNYLLLVTDGYWNSDSYNDLTQLDGTAKIGNQDNTLSRPQYDGAQPSTTCTDSGFSSCGTLADVAAYYANTDIRSAALNNTTGVGGADVATNNVPVSANDSNTQQHVTFFGMALGAPGTLRYQSDYQTATSGDYYDILNNKGDWPAAQANDATTIDDLWHATVNGRGKFFSARDPSSVGSGLSEALATIKLRIGSAAAAATSNLMPVPGDNYAYVASYATQDWWGDLQARNIDLSTGAVSDPANASPNECVDDTGCAWSAQKKLDAMAWASRSIKIAPTTGSSGAVLRAFTYAGLDATTEQGYFDPASTSLALSQYGDVHTSYPTEVTGTNLVNYLRGDRSLEKDGNTTVHSQIWRKRAHVLGDIVSTQPVYVRAPVFSYLDAGYLDVFATDNATRDGVVYVSANDGMLHAFAALDTTVSPTVSAGTEMWAFIPKLAMHSMGKLADVAYAHQYFVDGPITVGDVNFGGSDNDWHTILVAGLGGGGQEYFALDITHPEDPRFLWEITNATTDFENLGYTYGNASINKLPNGEWAVFFTSGYNNADGHGYLYAVNPETGVLKTGYPLSTSSSDGGSTGSPINLGKISAWVDALQTDNTAQYIYGGDMDGNLWRFDLAPSATGHTTKSVFKLAHLEGYSRPTTGTPVLVAQPITTKPEMALVDTTRVIYVGTGSYLTTADKSTTDYQSFYAIKDTLAADMTTWNPRTDTEFQIRTLFETRDDGSLVTLADPVSGATVDARLICSGKSVANGGTTYVDHTTEKCAGQPQPTDNGAGDGNATIDWASASVGGWYLDLLDSGERMNVDINLSLGTLTFATNVPASGSCTAGGYSWLNYIDFATGVNVENTSTIVSQKLANALIVGINVVKLPNNTLAAIVTTSDYKHATLSPSFAADQFQGRRNLWREFELY